LLLLEQLLMLELLQLHLLIDLLLPLDLLKPEIFSLLLREVLVLQELVHDLLFN